MEVLSPSTDPSEREGTKYGERARVAGRGSGDDNVRATQDVRAIEQVAAGDLPALAELYDRYKTMAYSIAYRITNDATLAEDVVQDAFLGAWRNAGQYAVGRGAVRTWLLAIVRYRAVDVVRRRRSTLDLQGFTETTPTSLTSPDAWIHVAAGLDAEMVRRAMDVLSDAQREAIELAYFAGLTQGEIAQRMDTPLGTVKSRIRLGLLAMRRTLSTPEPGAAREGGVAIDGGT